MTGNWRFNGFYDSAKLTGLFEATRRRESCRSFLAAPTTEQWNALLTAADTLVLPGVRIALGMCDTSLFQPLMGMLMKFENVQRFAAIILKDDQPKSVVNAGISGEMFLLRAVELGLGGCWVSGTYKRGQVGLHLADGEKILALIALGRPKTVPVPPIHRKRKEVETLCANFATLPSAFKEAALYVRSAPSAMNRQPWRMRPDGEKKLILSVSLSVQRVDLGIALCHALLALGSTPAQFTLDDDALSTTIELL